MNYESPQEIKRVLDHYGISLKKRWGQNFLINRPTREKIARLIAAKKNEIVWEIGPGLGALTVLLLPYVKRLIAFEIDRGLVRWLKEEFKAEKRFIICQGDVIKTWPEIFAVHGLPEKVCGNLPYNSASKIITSFIEHDLLPNQLVFTVQRELAERMLALPGTKNYSSFSILCQAMFSIKAEGDLKPGSFFPAPDVFSTIIVLRPHKPFNSAAEREVFLKLTRVGFTSRRKTLKNNIWQASSLSLPQKQQVLNFLQTKYNIDTLRAEELPVSVFLALARKVSSSP
jgi:16S rRNA (adenine1518-N6/adenine1519-N6)-dimethyltransferase